MDPEILRKEQERIDIVMQTIKEQIEMLTDETGRRSKEIAVFRKNFWDEVKVNTDTFDDYLETILSLRQQAQILSVNQSTHRQASRKLAAMRRMQESPYFGRINFVEDGSSRSDRIYIGVSSLTDKNGDNFLVYDWRAPISSMYYDYPPGPAKYTTPEGTIHGKLEQKWQYLIKGGKLESMFDTSITIGDEVLQQVLGKGTDKHLHSIVATIQKEQNMIIRHDRTRLLIVQGSAGSGKTSAALQRIAYLLYKYRDWLKADQIILFSPNSMFNSYVSNVLPELGEENMQQVTFQEYLDHRLSRKFQLEGPYEQLEFVLTSKKNSDYHTRLENIQFKATREFFTLIKNYRKSLEDSGMIFKGIVFRRKTIITAEQITNQFYSNNTSLRFHNRLEKLAEWLNKQLEIAEKNERTKQWVREEIELLSNEEYQKARSYLLKKGILTEDLMDDYDREIEALGRLIVKRKFKPLRQKIKDLSFIDMKGIYRQLFSVSKQNASWMNDGIPERWSDICRLTRNMIDENKLYYEDATPYLLLQELIQGFQMNNSIKHVLIDEAQDYSPFQFEFLKRLFPAAKMTVLGDFNQAIFAHANKTSSFDSLKNLYGPDETDVIHLMRSYRSTKPIIEFTRQLIPDGERITPFERDGEKPVLIQLSNMTELHQSIIKQVSELQNRGYHSIAIICKSAVESAAAYKALQDIEDIKLIRSNSMEYEQGVVIIPVYLAKGIEFDAVIIYDVSEEVYGDESLRRFFYTACTRAMHFLQLYCTGKPSFLLASADADSYIQS